MLRNIEPKEQLAEISQRFGKLFMIGWVAAYSIVFLFKGFVENDISSPTWPLVLIAVGSAFVTQVCWFFVVMWLGRLSVRQTSIALSEPNAHPRLVSTFLESWWSNETVLDAFVVVFQVTCTVAGYRYFGFL